MSQAGVINVGAAAGEVMALTGNDAVRVMPDGTGNINVIGAGGANVTGNAGTHTLTINVVAQGYTWHTVTSATNVNPLVAENAYVCGGVANVVFLLPAAASVGDTFIVTGYTSFFQITQNAGQSIIFGSQTTTTGVGGSVTSTGVGDHVQIVCIVTNSTFKIVDSIGNLTIV